MTTQVAGLRVVRGPKWSQGEADGGEGHVGTITLAKSDGTVEVTWDSGDVTTGKANQLLVLDNATVGVRHSDIACNGCRENGIVGMRWRCAQCDDYELCSLCYFDDQHDTGHQFDRFESPNSPFGDRVDRRNKSKKIRVMGIFPDARVSRGRDWEWNDQDGGIGAVGRVLDVVTPASHSSRSTVKVEWSNNFKNVYRVGFKGKVDLRYVEEAPGGECYPTHLPELDPANYVKVTPAGSDATDSCLNEGDQVVVAVTAEELQQLQKARSGWAVGMLQVIGKVGEVKGFASNGDVVVAFGSTKYRLVPRALKKVGVVQVGDHVRVLSEEEEVKLMQENHGGYNEDMKGCLGKVGEVVKVDRDGDAAVQFGEHMWVFNPACLTQAPGEDLDEVIVDPDVDIIRQRLQQGDSTVGALNQLMAALFLAATSGNISEKLMMRAIVDEDVSKVKDLLAQDNDLAQAEEQGISALHVAANRGNLPITRLLVEHGADPDKVDGDGDSPLLICMKHETIAEYLISKGASIAASNNNQQTAGHKAAQHGTHRIVQLLIEKGADLNAQDVTGDTPLHDAITNNRHSVAEVLLAWPKVNIRIKNKNGFNPLQFTAIKGTPTIAELLVRKDRSLVDEQKADGFTALQIAAVNNHTDVMKILLEQGKAKVDIRNGVKATALHAAASEAYMDAVQLLIEHGADVNAKDKDGDRPLHMVMMVDDSSEADSDGLDIFRLLLGQTKKVKEEERIRIAQLLLQAGAAPDARNDAGKTAFDVCKNVVITDAVKKFITFNPNLTKSHKPDLVRQMSASASKLCRKCLTSRASVLFVPCGHRSACYECCTKNKLRLCPQCSQPSKSRFDANGKEISTCIVM